MNTTKPVNEKEIVNRILSGESITRVQHATGMTSAALYSILYKNRINYKKLLSKRRAAVIKEKATDCSPMKPYFYSLYTHEESQKRLTDAIVSDVNRVWGIINMSPRRQDILLHGHFKPVDILKVYTRFSSLINIVRSCSPQDTERFLTEEEIIVQYNLLCKKMKENPDDNAPKNAHTRDSRKLILVAQLKEMEKKLGRPPLKADLNGSNSLYMRCYRYFGSLAAALEAAGIVPAMVFKKARATAHAHELEAQRKAAIENVKNLHIELGRNPLPEEIEPGIAYAETKLGKFYPTFALACRAAGFKGDYSYKGSFYTSAQMLEMIKNLAAIIGRIPSHRDLRQHLPVSYMAFHRRFGSLGRTLLEAGVIDQVIFEKKYKPHIEKSKKTLSGCNHKQDITALVETL
jgi:Homing endonuclease associated repeat